MLSSFNKNQQNSPPTIHTNMSISSGQKHTTNMQPKYLFLKTLSCVTLGAIALVVVSPSKAQAQFIQRSFLNPSFEQDLTPSTANPASPGATTIPISTRSNCFIQVDQTSVPGWSTTHPLVNGGGDCPSFVGPGSANLIELWTRNFQGVIPPDGNVFAELNAERNSEFFQNLCLLNNETIQFSVDHRGRSSATVEDVANFAVNNQGVVQFATSSSGNPNSITSLTPTNATNIVTNAPAVASASALGWVRYSGSLRYTGTSSNIPVGFDAVSTASTAGNGITIGNFIDNAQFAGLPVIEIAAATSGGAPESEANPTTNPPQIRIVGLVETSFDVTVTVLPSSTATLGADFQFAPGSNSTGNQVVIPIPVGNYDGTAATGSLITIPIEIIQDTLSEGDETIVFQVEPNAARFLNNSTTVCGGSPISSSTYTIVDDEIDPRLILVKRITAINGDTTGFAAVQDDPNDNNDTDANWPNGFLVGGITATAVSGDVVDYTIYFLNTGNDTAGSVKICDPLSELLTYIPNSYDGSTPTDGGGTSNLGIELNFGGSSVFATGAADADRGQFVAAGTAPTGCVIEDPNNAGSLIPATAANNNNGTLTVDLATVDDATGTGTPNTAYGYIRFRSTVN